MSGLPILFLCLLSSPLAGAQAVTTLVVRTDLSCSWKLDGRLMGTIEANDSKLVPVSPGVHFVEAFTGVGGEAVQIRAEVGQDEKTVDILLKAKSAERSKTKAETPKESQGADAEADATWTDPATKLVWTGKDNGFDVDWDQAGLYCSKLQLAGHSDWRLPSLEELQGIYDRTVSVPTLFGNSYMADVHVKGNLKLTGWTWSGKQGDYPGKPHQSAWFFMLGSGGPGTDVGRPRSNFLHFSWDMRALCVRVAGD
jgi:hypothetical protein